MKQSLTARILSILAMASLLTFSFTGSHSAGATAAQSGVTLPNVQVYGLTTDNTIYVLNPGASTFTRVGRFGAAEGVDGNIIGIDVRPSDGQLYAVTDTGRIYFLFALANDFFSVRVATMVSTMNPVFPDGLQSGMDFNPVVNALRLIGSGNSNYAVVNGAGILATTAIQTSVAYAAGDTNAGQDPNISGIAYTNNYFGAPNTIIYLLDYTRNTLATIAPATAGGSSNTGGGQLITIGQIVDQNGNPLRITYLADIDCYTDLNGVNTLVGTTTNRIFTINVAQLPQNPQPGQTQNVVANVLNLPSLPNNISFADIALAYTPGTRPN